MPRNKGLGYARKAPKRKAPPPKRKAPPPVSDDETEHVPGSSMTQAELDFEYEDDLDYEVMWLVEEALRDAREDQHECRRRFCKYAAQTIACAQAWRMRGAVAWRMRGAVCGDWWHAAFSHWQTSSSSSRAAVWTPPSRMKCGATTAGMSSRAALASGHASAVWSSRNGRGRYLTECPSVGHARAVHRRVRLSGNA